MLRILKKIFIALIVFLFIVFILSRGRVYGRTELEYGVTFSKKQALTLNLDWRKLYSDVLGDLGVRRLRLPAYWDEIENFDGQYDWTDLDWQIDEAEKAGAEVILAVGGRLPRWPECHFPVWAKALPKAEREARILSYLEKTILRYLDRDIIVAWQVENEPFLSHFGDCPKLDESFLDKELALVKKYDDRPIVVSDSGELSIWIPAARRADIFGTTMYRDTYSEHLKRYIHYPITPGFFRLKKNLAGLFAHPEKWIVIELQAEPWTPVPYHLATQEERDRTMNLQKFREILEFSRQSGFREFYLWGVEWWYWEKTINNNDDLWNEARGLF
ncbi:hypothetical protein A2303_06900 [Candidatus Falkowbacteria bacterium RIFOXYB2_FULL_47_14]|uniref:Glycoside hydrolase family 5 domain-containing protein n=1 Tax=Candidatus Falkowbacteria bacterium RIFOXYA2_FULL_47_19 TaxID=1797994 RepID=A0A1F5SHG3_9BACT|nr:MAG: hypothetical protein A2227_00645 [Candidatus Falkowbacteria bacterium RIFOXYA2_FULL_47_19]OGF35492.1 MAG: hypothetical protein A2468_05625 [Candidatus Falkowbacteria bacterium RIFOXYC2_FULL_46_15]OGF43598.1 MAG: hypothetical protein A2303_06900 [Candidatus Falkowbacteria bacterium RIFOXYB2_FULL_47_14]